MNQAGIHVLISGRVQGVWYRESTKKKAQSLALTGWVKNLPNGQVELKAFGAPKALQALKAWLHRGPPLAKVNEVCVDDISWEIFDGFVVVR